MKLREITANIVLFTLLCMLISLVCALIFDNAGLQQETYYSLSVAAIMSMTALIGIMAIDGRMV